MKAGRELDALIAEKVMGWRNCEVSGWRETRAYGKPPYFDDSDPDVCINDYSTNIADAWLVVEKFDTQNHTVRISNTMGGDWSCVIHGVWGEERVVAENVPLAICLAALKAVGVEV